VGRSNNHQERGLDWPLEEAAKLGKNPLKGLAAAHLCGKWQRWSSVFLSVSIQEEESIVWSPVAVERTSCIREPSCWEY
jgi:hypothetical protein